MTGADRNSSRAPWLAVALLGVLAAACVALGFWQLDRAAETRALEERYAAAVELPPLSGRLDDLVEVAPAAVRYRVIELEGRYEPERQFLVDNVVRNGVPGYFVLTPFRPESSDLRLIVNRGWTRADLDRRVLPDVGVSAAPRRIAGRLDELPAPGLRLGGGNPPTAADAPLAVLSYPAMSELESVLARPLFAYSLLLDPGEPDGFEREWRGPAVDPARNLAYAGQWWLFAAVAGGAAVTVAWRTLRRRKG